MLVLLGILWISTVCAAEILDGIAAIVNGRIITLSDLRKERLILTALGDDPGNDTALLQQLIEKRLVEDQIAQFPELEVREQEVVERLKTITNPGPVSAGDLREAVSARIRRNEFFNQRFRQFLRTSDEEIQKYYDEMFVPEARNRGLPVPTLNQIKDVIQSALLDEKLAEQVKTWLEVLRRRSDIEILK
jgi:hypothetical protein